MRDATGVWLHSHGVAIATREEAERTYASLVAHLGMETLVK